MKSTKVLVTGCFDILHQEHLIFLNKAKAVGGLLLVGVETDNRVRQLKGPSRPINPLLIRIKNIQKQGIADQVFALPEKFSDPKAHRALINQIKPDVLAVSSHTSNLPAKRRLMKSIGGQVKIVHSHNPAVSTTKIIKKTTS